MRHTSTDRFIIRSPLLKLSDLAINEKELLEAYKKAEVREALFTASIDLYNELLQIESDRLTNLEDKRKVLGNLYKYYTRMCTRCTPYGLFAGLNIGNLSTETQILYSDKFSPKLRLDMDFLCNLYHELSNDPALLKALKFFPNNTLFKVGGQWRYVEYQFKDAIRFHNLVAIDDNIVLTDLIENSGSGETFETLKKRILDFDIPPDEAESYFLTLIQNQILISCLYPSVSGEEYQSRLFSEIEKAAPFKYKNLTGQLNTILNSNHDIIEKTKSTEQFLSQFNVRIYPNKLIQIDLLKETLECKLNKELLHEIEEVTDIVRKLKIESNRNDTLDRFRTAFYERYEDNFMPLNFIMDTDLGIGYKNAVVKSKRDTKRTNPDLENKIKKIKLNLYIQSVVNKSKIVKIDLAEIEALSNNDLQPLPTSYAFMGNLFFNADGSSFIRYKSLGGTTANSMLARFGHLNSEIKDLCVEITLKEDDYYNNVILAEVVHLPQGRIGNIITRPHFRRYEIPYLCFSTLPKEQQILASDLYVGIVNNRVVLFSKKNNCEIVPKLSNAHNYSNDSLPLYHFLCDLQSQNINSSVVWSWDELYMMEHLPRVIYNNVILSCERWNLKTAMFKVNKLKGESKSLQSKFEDLKIPQKFLIIEGDNELYIDIETYIGSYVFLKQCDKYENIILEEFIFSQENATDGYTNEIIIPFFRETEKFYEGITEVETNPDVESTFNPFSNCVFIKLYTGSNFAQSLLLDKIPELISHLKDSNIISHWFFIRYADPKYHLRIRFFLQNPDSKINLLNILSEYLTEYLASYQIWDIEFSTYKRELKRYGYNTINEAESWFSYNSEFVIHIFKTAPEGEILSIAILYVHHLLEQFNYGLSDKSEFVEGRALFFNSEFNVSKIKSLRLQLDNDFRASHKKLKDMLNKDYLLGNDSIAHILKSEIEKTNPVINIIISKNVQNKNKLVDILGSFIHMFINRLFSSDQRFIEMKLYYFMVKFYASEKARGIVSEIEKKYI